MNRNYYLDIFYLFISLFLFINLNLQIYNPVYQFFIIITEALLITFVFFKVIKKILENYNIEELNKIKKEIESLKKENS